MPTGGPPPPGHRARMAESVCGRPVTVVRLTPAPCLFSGGPGLVKGKTLFQIVVDRPSFLPPDLNHWR